VAKYLVSDFATTTLATGISSGAISCTVAAGNGALFPLPNVSTGTKFLATLQSATNPNTYEVVTVTARSTDTMTMTPTVNAYNAGDFFALRIPSALVEQLTQFDDVQAQSGNYAIDTGSANAYAVSLTPNLTAHVQGMPIRFQAAHSNTGASTFNDGAGSANLQYPGSSVLVGGEIVAGRIYTCIFNSGYFQLQLESSRNTIAFSVSGAISGTLSAVWTKDGNKVSIFTTSGLSATSTATSPIFLNSLPTEIQPSGPRIVTCTQLDIAGNSLSGWAQVNPNGAAPAEIRVDPVTVLTIGGVNYIADQGGFPSGMTCGFFPGWLIVYSI